MQAAWRRNVLNADITVSLTNASLMVLLEANNTACTVRPLNSSVWNFNCGAQFAPVFYESTAPRAFAWFNSSGGIEPMNACRGGFFPAGTFVIPRISTGTGCSTAIFVKPTVANPAVTVLGWDDTAGLNMVTILAIGAVVVLLVVTLVVYSLWPQKEVVAPPNPDMQMEDRISGITTRVGLE